MISSNIEQDTSVAKIDGRQQQPRESKWSYFYVGSWAWHIPLWFTLCRKGLNFLSLDIKLQNFISGFTFYVFGNVIRSIQGHSVS